MKLKNVWGGTVPIGSNKVLPQEYVPEFDRPYTKQENADISLFLANGYLVEEKAEPIHKKVADEVQIVEPAALPDPATAVEEAVEDDPAPKPKRRRKKKSKEEADS